MTTSSPAALARGRLGSIDAAIAILERVATAAAAMIVVVGVARETYRVGYQDGYRVADQVALDRPPRAEAPA